MYQCKRTSRRYDTTEAPTSKVSALPWPTHYSGDVSRDNTFLALRRVRRPREGTRMIFKPDIDFAKLLETRRMSHQDLAAFFGRLPTDGEIEWSRKEAMAKHPSFAPLIRSSKARGLYLMDQATGAHYRGKRILQTISGLATAIDMHEKCPTSELDAEALKRRDAIARCASTIKTELTRATKALPWERKT
jgi:hypothetical protein